MVGLERRSNLRPCLVAFLLLSIVSSTVAYASSPPSSSSSSPTSSKGCAEGYGYYVDDPDAICELLDKIGEGPPQDVRFCAALGCLYNPSNLTSPSSDQEDENQKRRT
jgi:hypothetical protein